MLETLYYQQRRFPGNSSLSILRSTIISCVNALPLSCRSQPSMMPCFLQLTFKFREEKKKSQTRVEPSRISTTQARATAPRCPKKQNDKDKCLPPMVGSWNSKNSSRTKRTTRHDFPTAVSPRRTSLKWCTRLFVMV